MNAEVKIVDVIVVGYGPTGLTLASLLGQQGHKVAVVERWPQLYGKPRLTHIDGETARLISLAADGDHALREAWTTPHYYWVNGKGRTLLDVGNGNTRKMLWDDDISVHQPHIEEAIHERVSSFGNVALFRGYEATSVAQDGDAVTLTCTSRDTGRSSSETHGTSITLCAQYLIACDGAKSFVRERLGVERIDFGFNERWLCVDTEPLKPLPERFNENAIQVCDPRRGHMFMPIGRKRQRFEFALLPDERTEDMQTSDAAFRMLKHYHGLGPDDVTLIRHLVYTFECRLVKSWRVKRIFFAGDAAHTNPPYLGQGACSGMRDASNLAWKLDLVLRGVADDALLDTYELERLPHAKQLMLGSRALGFVANTANPVKAAVRDFVFAMKLAPKPKFPVLTDGVLARDPAGKPQREAGALPSQGRIGVNGRTMRFDEHVGFGFALVSMRDIESGLPSALRSRLRDIGMRFLVVAKERVPVGQDGVVDVDGVYTSALNALGATAMLIRPDFVLYGHAVAGNVERLLKGLLTDLRAPHPMRSSNQFSSSPSMNDKTSDV